MMDKNRMKRAPRWTVACLVNISMGAAEVSGAYNSCAVKSWPAAISLEQV